MKTRINNPLWSKLIMKLKILILRQLLTVENLVRKILIEEIVINNKQSNSSQQLWTKSKIKNIHKIMIFPKFNKIITHRVIQKFKK